MVSLIVLNNVRLAQSFIDYMACQDITIKILPTEEGDCELWLMEDEKIQKVQEELELFIQSPYHPRYSQASWQRSNTSGVNFTYRKTNFWSLIKAQAGWFTLLVMLTSIGIYALKLLGFGQDVFNWLHFPVSSEQKWQLWRWVSPALFHFSALHIVFNALWWWQLGGDIERQRGSSKLVLIFIVSAVLSGVGQYWVDGPSFGGLSGVVYALVGYIWIYGWLKPESGLQMSKPIIGFMLVWLMLGYIQPIMAIANTAHLVGLLCGMGLAAVEAKLLAS